MKFKKFFNQSSSGGSFLFTEMVIFAYNQKVRAWGKEIKIIGVKNKPTVIKSLLKVLMSLELLPSSAAKYSPKLIMCKVLNTLPNCN